ncbi:MAG: DUF4276 family protein [candidate division KSB1 bacterium]|nr:DUF4276 family protein [candidate division KSB1 bacterium]MDZ7304952.1 DUF4276 family protein [candidate division KSB1 bacterium]MDZ7314015.1 DUF4276 family protein [candidate division KSB1 bacterium]
MRIIYFLEDRAQEGFIKALVERIAKDESIPLESLIHDIRSARGGSKVITEFKNFVKDIAKVDIVEIDLLVVAIDGNCKGYQDRVKQLHKAFRLNHPLQGKVIYAVPDPHVERWYLIDQKAFKLGVGIDKAPDLPPYKCKKAYYKQELSKALKDANVSSLLGGTEYAERIVDHIENLEALGRHDAGFKNFVDALRIIFRVNKRQKEQLPD